MWRTFIINLQLARCFPSPLGQAVFGLNSAARGRLSATGLQGAALRLNTVVKIARHFGLPSAQFPPLQAGKGRRSPSLPVDIQPSVGVKHTISYLAKPALYKQWCMSFLSFSFLNSNTKWLVWCQIPVLSDNLQQNSFFVYYCTKLYRPIWGGIALFCLDLRALGGSLKQVSTLWKIRLGWMEDRALFAIG